MKLIVAVDENWGIGKKGDLLKSIPDDMKFFRETTKRAILVMGYNTLLSFPGSKPLPGRLNIVLADIPELQIPGVVVCNTMDQLLSLLENFCSDDVYVIGGGMMYRQLLPYCDTALITKMRFSGDADTFIPNLDELPEWSVKSESEIMDYEGLKFSFVEYRNSSPNALAFRSFDKDITEVFASKKEIEFNYIDCKGSYRSDLRDLLERYFYPIRDGVAPTDVRFFLMTSTKEEKSSFGQLLYFKRLTASEADFQKLNDRYRDEDDCTGRACPVRVKKSELDEFITFINKAAFEDVTAKFKADKP
ncbi:MAG: dihydrofolate reductase [Ruminococcus sp.]|nr:dihydrofolate reductase [Ruminococcus sp.]